MIEKVIKTDPDEDVRVRAVHALGHFWEKKGTSDTREIAFDKMAKIAISATGQYKARLVRALRMWHTIPAATMSKYGITSQVEKECEALLYVAPKAAQSEDIWAG